jgi:O-acetylhomoserine/O-acetylserine sulfhydrylase-like pyridoxal-dependent enzyme
MRERTHGQGFATRAIHAGERPDPVTHAHKPPIFATATYTFDTAAEKEDAASRPGVGARRLLLPRTGNRRTGR